jgi:uncharacterized protein
MTGLVFTALLACGGPKLPTATVTVGDVPVTVELATNQESRALGLKHRDSMAADQGMLFMYPDNRTRGFWMEDTRIPLSIAFINKDGEIVRIADMTPFSRDRVPSLYPVPYALEMNRGWFEGHGIEKGAKVTGFPDVAIK